MHKVYVRKQEKPATTADVPKVEQIHNSSDEYIPNPNKNPLQNDSKEEKNLDYIEDFSKLSLDNQKKWLYIDGLNFGNRFFDRGGNHWNIVKAVKKIKKFISIATKSGWSLKVFIDASRETEEAIQKWIKRREQEVAKGSRKIPHGMDCLLGDAFKDNGIEVLYSLDADNDDTLASYAHRDGAAILSGDQDFFRYRDLRCPIYGNYELKKEHLELTLLEPNERSEIISKRDIIVPPPNVLYKDPALRGLPLGLYRRGTPSPLTKKLGNPHLVIRPLRQAMYSRKNVTGAMREIIINWENDRVVWNEAQVNPDPSFDHLLDNPQEALEFFFPKTTLLRPEGVSDLDWQNHLYAIHAVIYELCTLGSKKETSFLKMLLPVATEFKANNKLIKPVTAEKPPAYEAECRVCKVIIKMTKWEVEFYVEKGFNLPKNCKDCKKKSKERNFMQNNEEKSQETKYGKYNEGRAHRNYRQYKDERGYGNYGQYNDNRAHGNYRQFNDDRAHGNYKQFNDDRVHGNYGQYNDERGYGNDSQYDDNRVHGNYRQYNDERGYGNYMQYDDNRVHGNYRQNNQEKYAYKKKVYY